MSGSNAAEIRRLEAALQKRREAGKPSEQLERALAILRERERPKRDEAGELADKLFSGRTVEVVGQDWRAAP